MLQAACFGVGKPCVLNIAHAWAHAGDSNRKSFIFSLHIHRAWFASFGERAESNRLGWISQYDLLLIQRVCEFDTQH